MPGKSSTERLALERQNSRIMAVFEGAGFAHIAPDILQPADIFLERSGENIRASTFVFADPEGNELCLRPDLTVPACRYHLAHASKPAAEARYSYCGPAFRFAAEATEPSEFGQAGIEWFAAPDRDGAEATVLKLAIDAVRAAGLVDFRVTIGDVGLFRALLADTDLPDRWRRRLLHHFWRPQALAEMLAQFTGDRARQRTSISANVDAVARMGGEAAARWAASNLTERGIPLTGGRDAKEIAARLVEKAADRSERLLTREEAARIRDYQLVIGAPDQAIAVMRQLNSGRLFASAVDRLARLLARMDELGTAIGDLVFAASFGRDLEYYTGFVFQIEALNEEGAIQIAGGGRYDDLLSDIGSPVPVPAVGCAIDLTRLLATVGG
jgi:ATP phosphoribosyltransferase regulatory subunit